MKKALSILTFCCLLIFSAVPVWAAPAPQEVSVTIDTPTSVESKPVYENNLDITITNTTDHKLENLIYYLSIVDVDRGFTCAVDEFGETAYKTRTIDTLDAGQSLHVKLPVKVTYVGHFQFLISVTNLTNGLTSTSTALPIHMVATSQMNRQLVMIVAILVPILLILAILFIQHHRKQLGKRKE